MKFSAIIEGVSLHELFFYVFLLEFPACRQSSRQVFPHTGLVDIMSVLDALGYQVV